MCVNRVNLCDQPVCVCEGCHVCDAKRSAAHVSPTECMLHGLVLVCISPLNMTFCDEIFILWLCGYVMELG